jgi:hypothetical protein
MEPARFGKAARWGAIRMDCSSHGIGPRTQCFCGKLRLAPLLFPLLRLLANGFFAVTASATLSAGERVTEPRLVAPALTAASPCRRTKRGRRPSWSGTAAFELATSRSLAAHHARWHACSGLVGAVTCLARCSAALRAVLQDPRAAAVRGYRRVADTCLGGWLAMSYGCAVIRRTGGFLPSVSPSLHWKSPA